jgi:DNA-binding CsgD family transcriptional regulator
MEPPEWKLLESIAPHLQRSASIHDMLSRAGAATDSIGAAVAAAGLAIFLLTEDCRIVVANARAEDLVRRGIGLRIERGRLAAATPSLTQRLRAFVCEAARPARGGGDIGGTLELSRGENHAPFLAHVIPLAANRTAAIFDVDRPAAAVFVLDPAAGIGVQVQRFASLWGLTPAETRVLSEIIGGNGLQAAAQRLKISRATARSHADRIFGKTGTNRQTELIRRFFEMSLPGSPGAA